MVMTQLWLGAAPVWFRVDKFDGRAAALADRHYSRQTVGSDQTLGPGQTLLLLTPDERAVWGVVCNLDPVGAMRWRNSIFRNESPTLSSTLIEVSELLADLKEDATRETYVAWRHRYGGWPAWWSVRRYGMEVWRHVACGIPPAFAIALEAIALRTEIDVEATSGRRSKRSSPGHCYQKAGWRHVRDIAAGHGRSAKIELEAPPP